MSGKKVITAALVIWFMCFGGVWAQEPSTAYDENVVAGPLPTPGDERPDTQVITSAGLSDWITYDRPCCDEPADGVYSLGSEFYFRVGPTFPIGGQTLSRALQNGWMLQGGGRFLLFNPVRTKAWVVDAGISTHFNDADEPTARFTITDFIINADGTTQRVVFGQAGIPGVTIRSYNRTFANLGFGREWYIFQPEWSEGNKWRVGADIGGRYGSSSIRLNEIQRRTDVVGAVYTAIHTDYEIPCGCCTWMGGIRGEWAYTWSDILQQTSDLMDLSLLFNIGFRY